mmetsp:Transcript_24253/g.54539  ORF Transcript_24253/g.54539 Transcript_24253/m.54539 type:complete len:217 (+) Transcript_24253:58-708(+)
MDWIINSNWLWETIGTNNFCSFKVKKENFKFCNNKFNLTGFCSKQSCPLSNDFYSTVIRRKDRLFLFIKNNHEFKFPSKIWKKYELSRNYIKALSQIDLKLSFWPKFFLFKSKQKLTRFYQIIMKEKITKIVKIEKQIKNNNNILQFQKTKLEKEYFLQKSVEHELLKRLHTGMYGTLYHKVPILKWKNMLQQNICNYKNSVEIEKSVLNEKIYAT